MTESGRPASLRTIGVRHVPWASTILAAPSPEEVVVPLYSPCQQLETLCPALELRLQCGLLSLQRQRPGSFGWILPPRKQAQVALVPRAGPNSRRIGVAGKRSVDNRDG